MSESPARRVARARRVRLASFAASAAAVACGALSARADDAGAGAWYMEGANAERTSFVDVEPVRSAPAELWRRKPDEGCIAEPVAWNGVVFTLSQVKTGVQILTAIDGRNGAVLARAVRMKRVGGTGRLAVWKDVVIVVENDQTEGYSWKGNGLYPKWTGLGSSASPCLVSGVALIGLRSLDLATGETVGLTGAFGNLYETGSVSAAAIPGDRALLFGAQVGPHGQYKGTWLRGQTIGLARCSGGVAAMKPEGSDPSVPIAEVGERASDALLGTFPVRLDPPDAASPGAWILDAGRTLSTPSGKSGRLVLHVDKGANEFPPGVVRPAVVGCVAYTLDEEGDLIEVRADGTFETVAGSALFPKAAHPVRLSAARGVLYTPGWAYDLAEKRVLWTHEFAATDVPAAPAIPLAAGVVAVRTAAGEIVCLADPQRPATPAAAPAPVAAQPAGPPPLPVAGDGVLLADGRQVLGDTQLYGVDGAVTVTTRDGARHVFQPDEVLVAESGGATLVVGPESDVYRVWETALRGTIAPRLENVATAAGQLGLRTEGERWIDRARRWGLAESRVAELTARLPRSDREPVEENLRRLYGQCRPILDACSADVVRAAEWCGARGFVVAGAVLASRSASFDRPIPGADAATKLIPAAFRMCMGKWISGERWVQWANGLLAAKASVVEPGDPVWQRVSRDWWAPDRCLAFRTRDLLVFSRSTDPAAVVPCLSGGQAAIRGLHRLLGVADPVRPAGDDDRLIVLLHETRKDYLAEAGARGGGIDGSAGYYSPSENLSRFFVANSDAPQATVLGRDLVKVLAHELTHHYIEARWTPSLGQPRLVDRAAQPGFWIVEGIAQFMGDQIVDADAGGLTFEDPSVLSVMLTVALEKKGRILPMATLVDLDQRGFAALGEETEVEVSTGSFLACGLSAKNVFYEQAGALVFFMRNARGDEGRRAFVEYLRRFYLGGQERESWKVLGFGSADELQRAFVAWLRTLK